MRSLFLSVFLLTASCAQSSAYRIEPAPALLPTPTPQAESDALTGTAAAQATEPLAEASATVAVPARSRAKGSATATPTVTPTPTETATYTPEAKLFYLQPFADRRGGKQIFKGRSNYDHIRITAQGLSSQAKAWSEKPFGDFAFLFHRQFGRALADSGLRAAAAEEPLNASLAQAMAMSAGARYLVSGEIKRFEFEKHGADFLGTSFSGTNYELEVQYQLQVQDLSSGQKALSKLFKFKHTYYDPKRLGNDDSKTFPGFFVAGLEASAAQMAGLDELRALGDLPPYTPTPTATRTSQAAAPANNAMPTATPEPTPEAGPYWVNPKTGKRVDPDWNFDPSDGTPRKDFILRQPEKKEPGRATDRK